MHNSERNECCERKTVVKSSEGGIVEITFQLNGKIVSLEVSPWDSALSVLRDRLGLTGTKEGCGIGECGACTILVNGLAVDSCLMLAAQLDGRKIETVEELVTGGKLHRLQEKFLSHGAVQCGFCTPGMLMSTKSLLERNPSPEKKDVVEALSGNLCRCTGYVQIVEAVEDAAKEAREAGKAHVSACESCKREC
jgi:aerobic carbon-monoxide dehydrogenase small subunit